MTYCTSWSIFIGGACWSLELPKSQEGSCGLSSCGMSIWGSGSGGGSGRFSNISSAGLSGLIHDVVVGEGMVGLGIVAGGMAAKDGGVPNGAAGVPDFEAAFTLGLGRGVILGTYFPSVLELYPNVEGYSRLLKC